MVAMEDITQDLLSRYKKQELYNFHERFIVLASDLNNKANIKLNAKLGLRSINRWKSKIPKEI